MSVTTDNNNARSGRMANKKSVKVQISRDCFLRIIREKGYTEERLGAEPEIDRSGRTI